MSIKRYVSRLTTSARGEKFNPLIYPFLLTTFAYGLGFMIPIEAVVGSSFLYETMYSLGALIPLIWGGVAIATVVMGATFLLFNIPPAGTYSGLLGFAAWFFVAILYGLGGDWLVLVAIALPNAFFWFWQFLSLSRFKREDAADNATMYLYNHGGYDNELAHTESRVDRVGNRGRDRQKGGKYENPDDGGDESRPT